MADRKQTATVDLKVRMKEPLRAALEKAAHKKGRSLNAEAVQRLERSFRSESQNLVSVIVNATIGGELKWVTPEHGREMRFSPSAKAQMKQRICDFIASLPEAEESSLSDEEFEELSRMVDEANRKIAEQKKGRGK